VANVFAIQDEIASAVAHSLRLRPGSPAPKKVVNLEAYKLYLKGRHHWNAGRFEAAIGDFSQSQHHSIHELVGRAFSPPPHQRP
jgi:hypothetical protein